jgi:Cellulose binding domain
MSRTSRRRFIAAAAAPAVLALAAGGFLYAHGKANNAVAMVAQAANGSSTIANGIAISVNAADVLGTVPDIANGLNTAVYDGHLNDSASTTAVAAAGITALRYPGGSISDAYHWQTNTMVPGAGGYANPNNGFDDFMGIAQKTGASPIITVNYGSGTAAEAAAWVTYANVTKKYGIKYWEVGNEIPGDGTYGAQWEYNTKPKGATTYADNIADYITQMKAADPGIKVGAVLTTWNSWPDGLVASKYGDTEDWNTTVLKKDGPKLDFVIVHDYPSSGSEPALLTQYQNIAAVVQHTRAEINQYAGSNAANVQIMITETNASFESDSVPAALYAADSYLTFLQNGVENIDWWDLHNGPSQVTTLPDGTTDYGDGGVLSVGGCTGGTCEPAANTPFPAYYGLQAVGGFAPAGAQMIGATSANATVTAYAVKTTDGTNLMLVNHDPHSSEPVSISYAGFNPASVTSAEQLSDANPKLSPLSGADANSLTLPAYSITVLHLSGSSSSSVSTPTPTSTPTSGATSTPSSGPTSTPSSGSVATASCTVTTSTVTWPGGYTENVRITNTGSTALTGWKVTFSLPAPERVTTSWNATHRQYGQLVSARPASYDPTIAAGATLPFGFNASDPAGTAATPTSYALNGVRCKSVA